MAGKRKFNFGAVDKTFTLPEKQNPALGIKNNGLNNLEQEAGKDINFESADCSEPEKIAVTEQIGRIERVADYKKAFNFKLVPRKKIVFHQGNDFPMEEIEKRAESILEVGLIHNLEALYDEERDVYILESGEKRTKAIDMLIERYRAYEGNPDAADYKNYLKHVKQFEVEGYPVNVKYFDPAEYDFEENSEKAEELKNIDSQIRLNRANIDVLALDSVLIRKKIEEIAELYARRNALVKKEDRINVNKTIAEEFHMSSRQVQNYKAISKLIPELQELFDKKGISIKEGAGYSNLDEDDQRQLLRLFEAGEDKTEINALYEKLDRQKKEIEAGRKELEKLEKERQDALDAAVSERAAASRLEKEIRAEIEREQKENSEADRQHMKHLQDQLNQANKKIAQHESRNNELKKEQEKKIADLEQKLAMKEKQAIVMPTKIAKSAFKLESILHSVQDLKTQFFKTLEEYQNIYVEGAGELSPEEFTNRFKQML